MPIRSDGTPEYRRPMVSVPEWGNRVSIRHRGDTDTFDVFHGAYHIGYVDSTRDCTGDRWAVPNGGTRTRFSGPYSVSDAARYVVRTGREE